MSHLALLPGRFAVCRLSPDDAVPEWAAPGQFFSITRTAGELSIVCAEGLAPPGANRETGWRILEVAGPLDFSLTGILAGIAAPLADAGVVRSNGAQLPGAFISGLLTGLAVALQPEPVLENGTRHMPLLLGVRRANRLRDRTIVSEEVPDRSRTRRSRRTSYAPGIRGGREQLSSRSCPGKGGNHTNVQFGQKVTLREADL